MNHSKTTLLGRLSADPSLNHTADGTPVCTFTIVTNEQWRDKDGNRQQRPTYHDCVQWGPGGEATAKYGAKGRLVLVEGMNTQRSYESNKFVERNSVDRFFDSIKGQKSVSTEKVADMIKGLKAAKQRASEVRVSMLQWCDSPQTKTTPSQDALPHPEERDNSATEDDDEIPF